MTRVQPILFLVSMAPFSIATCFCILWLSIDPGDARLIRQ